MYLADDKELGGVSRMPVADAQAQGYSLGRQGNRALQQSLRPEE